MDWKTFRKAITGALAAGIATAATSVTAGATVGATVLATVLAVVGAFGAVYVTPANEQGPVPPSAAHLASPK